LSRLGPFKKKKYLSIFAGQRANGLNLLALVIWGGLK